LIHGKFRGLFNPIILININHGCPNIRVPEHLLDAEDSVNDSKIPGLPKCFRLQSSTKQIACRPVLPTTSITCLDLATYGYMGIPTIHSTTWLPEQGSSAIRGDIVKAEGKRISNSTRHW
jgi:hypothetical protein